MALLLLPPAAAVCRVLPLLTAHLPCASEWLQTLQAAQKMLAQQQQQQEQQQEQQKQGHVQEVESPIHSRC
jgi:hypothetical protein